ncbi:MAG TPA: pyruvate kinase [bacterium]|nr:pyruvate kinase [bacterium]
MRRAKIVATVGPASESEEILTRLLEAGVDVFRLNFSHGSYEKHEQVYRRIRTLADRVGRPIAILQDLQGPKIRLGKFPNGKVEVKTGQRFIITARKIMGGPGISSTDYPSLPEEVKEGDRILIDDGLIVLSVRAVKGQDVHCEVIAGGPVGDRKGLNLPGAMLKLPAMTAKDKKDLEFGVKLGVDFIALSFVRSAHDVKQCKKLIAKLGGNQPVIAKLEKPQALDDLINILEEAGGAMVARGDLGVEMDPERVPLAQKLIIAQANRLKKPVITATQMLESMREHPVPTRAEASDVANAIFDGTDAVMLSGETAAGKYPIEAVRMMVRIIETAESGKVDEVGRVNLRRETHPQTLDATEAVARAAAQTAEFIGAQAIVAFTRSGRSALQVSKYRPAAPILAFTPEETTRRRMALYWGIVPRLLEELKTVDEMTREVERALIRLNICQSGDPVLLVSGAPMSATHPTNMLVVHVIGGFHEGPAGVKAAENEKPAKSSFKRRTG